MKSISQTTQQMESISKKTSAFFRRYHVGQILRAANACKLKGFSSILVFLVLVSIIFENRSLYMQRRLHEDSLPFGKDTAYRFLNSCHTNWRKFTLLLAARIINETIKPLTDAGRRCAIVVDDSLFSRSRSKRVELLANVYDHVSRRYTKGFRLLVLGWTDGNTFLPLTFCLLSTSKEKNRLNEASASVDARSNGGKQRKLAQMEAPAVVLNLLQEVKATGIPAQYVLFDTWFCSPSSLKAIHDLGYDVTAMAKKSKKVRYLCEGKISNVKAIYKEHKKRRGRSRYLLSVDAVATKQGESRACAIGLRAEPQQAEGLSRPRHDRPLAFGGRSHPALREALGHRGVLQSVQVLPAARQGLSFRLLRCDDGACRRRLHTIYAPGCRGT